MLQHIRRNITILQRNTVWHGVHNCVLFWKHQYKWHAFYYDVAVKSVWFCMYVWMLTYVFSSWCSGVNGHNDSMTELKRQGCGAMIQIYGNTILTTAWFQKLRGLRGTQNMLQCNNSYTFNYFFFSFFALNVCWWDPAPYVSISKFAWELRDPYKQTKNLDKALLISLPIICFTTAEKGYKI